MFSRSFSKQNFLIWFVLAFQAGCINAGGFLACHRFVTHTTGFATYFGAELAGGHTSTAFGMLSVPLFFILGSVISALLIDRQLTLKRYPYVSFVLFLILMCLITVTACGVENIFGKFGEPLSIVKDYSLLALLCLTSGMQNALITTASGSVVRTTHLTGLSTDLGIGLVRVITAKLNHKDYGFEGRANIMRVGTISSFILGSTVSSFLFLSYEYLGFLLPTGTALILFIYGITTNHRRRKQLAFNF